MSVRSNKMNKQDITKFNKELENLRHIHKRLSKLINKQRSSEKNGSEGLKGGIEK